MAYRAKSPLEIPKEFITPINLNRLNGRLIHLPAPKNLDNPKTILFVQGQHSSHERVYATLQLLNEFGEVYSFDLPGYGGMDSPYSIHQKATYDFYADYLYTVMKSQLLTKDITFFGFSYGSQVMTRMFQKYPESQNWASTVFSLTGFGSGKDFKFTKFQRYRLYTLVYPMSTRLGSFLFQKLIFNRLTTSLAMFFYSKAKSHKMQTEDQEFKKKMIQMEKYLWTSNDHRTHAACAISMLTDDLRRFSEKKIHLTVHNIITENDQYFDNDKVAKTFSDLYDGYETSPLNLKVHAPSMTGGKEEFREALSAEVLEKLAN